LHLHLLLLLDTALTGMPTVVLHPLSALLPPDRSPLPFRNGN
jgi:hypothetical protein